MKDLFKKLVRLQTTTLEERRRDVREELTAGRAVIDDQSYPVGNWSASGFVVGPCALEPEIGKRLKIEFHISLADRQLVFSTMCLVVRRDESKGMFAGTYLGVDPESQNIIDAHFEILTGENLRRGVKEEISERVNRLRGKTED